MTAVEPDRWPVADGDGYYQSYKLGNRWYNWWARHKPGFSSMIVGHIKAKDESNIPGTPELDKKLPMKTPYWLLKGKKKGKKKKVGAEGCRATWIGHACVLAEVDGCTVLTDPVFSKRSSFVQWAGPKRYRPPACDVEQLPPKVDAVVISHTHYDHLDYNSVKQLNKRYGKKLHWFVPMDMGSWLCDNFGMGKQNVHELTWWQEKELPGSKVMFVLTPNNHWGRRTLLDENKALWGSWAVVGPNNKFWFGGDTAYADVFTQIGEKYGPFNLAAIPIGAFEPRKYMKHVHVNPEEAVMIHRNIQSLQSVGIHWGTFKLTFEHYLSPKLLTLQESKKQGLAKGEFAVPGHGETVEGRL